MARQSRQTPGQVTQDLFPRQWTPSRTTRIGTLKGLLEHPKVGASWEGFVIEQVLFSEPHDEALFWATYQGA